MNKLRLFTTIILLAIIGSMNIWAQKTVTYLLTGRPASLISSAKPLGVYAYGEIPKGAVPAYANGTPWESDGKAWADSVSISGFAGNVLIPQYVVPTQTKAVFCFKDFKYEITGVSWTYRCQSINFTTKGTTRVLKYDDTYTPDVAFSTAYEKTGTFASGTFNGLKQLEVSCTSNQMNHGVAISEFIIEYNLPEIVLSRDISQLDKNQTYNLTVSLAHPGAFTGVTYAFQSSKESAATVSSSGTDVQIVTKGNDDFTIITATASCDGRVIATSRYRVNIGKGTSKDYMWEQSSSKVFYGGGSNATTKSAGTSSGKIKRTGDTDYAYDWMSDTDWSGKSGWEEKDNGDFEFGIMTKDEGLDQRIGLGFVDYKQTVPKYTDVEVSYDFQATANMFKAAGTEYAFVVPNGQYTHGTEIIDFGEYNWTDGWTDASGFGTSSSKYNDVFGCNAIATLYNAKTSYDTETKIKSGTGTVISHISRHYDTDQISSGTKVTARKRTFSNTSATVTNLESIDKKWYFALLSYTTDHLTFPNEEAAVFDATNRSATFTYYGYITFNSNKPSDATGSISGSMNKQAITDTATQTNGRAIPGNTANNLMSNAFVLTDYEFQGWNTAADGSGTAYANNAAFSAYDEEGACGIGHVTLYAQWKKAEKAPETYIYGLIANGGSINGSETYAGTYSFGDDITSVPTGIRTGYKFLGYYDKSTDGVKVFDADGEPVNDGKYILNGKWVSTSDVLLYAQWEKEATIEKYTLKLMPEKGTTAIKELELIYGDTQNSNISEYTQTKTDYIFKGWYTKPSTASDAVMVYNANGESVILDGYTEDPESGTITPNYVAVNPTYFSANSTYSNKGNLTLYAHFAPATITITFNEFDDEKASYQVIDETKKYFGGATVDYGAITYNKVTIKRTLKKGMWNSICFPFSIDKKQMAKVFSSVKKFNSVEVDKSRNVATMKFVDVKDAMLAGVPYYVTLADSNYTAEGDAYVSAETDTTFTEMVFKNVTTTEKAGEIKCSDTEGNYVKMLGSFSVVSPIPDGCTYLLDNKYYISGNEYGGVKVTGRNKGFRCYFEEGRDESDGAKSLNTLFMDLDLPNYETVNATPDGIVELENNHMKDTAKGIYDLTGRRVTSPQKGSIYIAGGKKYIMK